MGVAFRSTSNPSVLKATVTVYEDSPIAESRVAVGYGRGIDGYQIVDWTSVNLQENVVDYNVGTCYFLKETGLSCKYQSKILFLVDLGFVFLA